MQKAKAAAEGILSRSGHHDTTVHERTAGAVQEEHIKPTRHEEVQEVHDREVHQDHHHTTVKPLQDREVRAEEHHHRTGPVVEKEFSHGNDADIRRQTEETAAQFRNTSQTHDTKTTSSTAPTLEGEHVHHHVHETVQPVIQKETITPEVVHTTIPVHETHHAGSKHHGTSVLPTQSLKEFTSGGGNVSGTHETENYYEGHPKPYDELMHQGRGTESGRDSHLQQSHHHHDTGTGTGTTTGATSGLTSGTNTTDHSSRVGDNLGTSSGGHHHHEHRTAGTDSLPRSGGDHLDSRVDNSTHGKTAGTAATGVSEPERGTDPNVIGQTQHSSDYDNKKTIGASGMVDFTSKS